MPKEYFYLLTYFYCCRAEVILLRACVFNSEFERIACGILTELCKSDHQKSNRLVTRPLRTWNGTTVFKLAEDLDTVDVMTHGCLQANLDLMWRGELLANDPVWRVRMHALSHGKIQVDFLCFALLFAFNCFSSAG